MINWIIGGFIIIFTLFVIIRSMKGKSSVGCHGCSGCDSESSCGSKKG